jgi:hypothetical protein
MSFLKHIRTAWNDFFEGSPTTTLVPKEYTSRQTPSVANVYVSNCLFNGCSSSSDGGALYCSTSVTYLLVESSSFLSCKTSSRYGGAIYFSNSGGECVLHKVCGNDCHSTYTSGSSNGQFAYIYVKDTASSKNYVNYSSVVRCVNDISTSWYTLRIYNGNVCFPSVNVSMNKCAYRSGIYVTSFTDSNSVTCSFLYTSFTDNIASQYNCICFARSGPKYETKYCNILRNSQVSSSDGTIYSNGNLLIADSCILENTASYIFYHGSSSYTTTLSNCTVDKTTATVGSLIIQKTVTKSFIHALNHISTENCKAEYDSAGTLTPITQPSSSSKKIMYYCTCKIFLCQPHLRDFVSLMWVFIFNIIHPSPSVRP